MTLDEIFGLIEAWGRRRSPTYEGIPISFKAMVRGALPAEANAVASLLVREAQRTMLFAAEQKKRDVACIDPECIKNQACKYPLIGAQTLAALSSVLMCSAQHGRPLVKAPAWSQDDDLQAWIIALAAAYGMPLAGSGTHAGVVYEVEIGTPAPLDKPTVQ